MALSIDYVDRCLPDYLQDHHNRDGELLVGITLIEHPDFDHLVNAVRDAMQEREDAPDLDLRATERLCSNLYRPSFRKRMIRSEEDAVEAMVWVLIRWRND